MPTYGYRCTDCGHTFERFQKITDAPVTVCESCGGGVKKMLYPVGIQFKGSGFYVNDYTKSGGGGSASGGDSESKSEAKPDAAADSKPAETAPAAAPAPAASGSTTPTAS